MNRNDVEQRLRPFFLFTFIVPCLMVFLHTDNDLWFLLNAGRHVTEFGIPYVEPFTMHEGFRFVMQQWLTSVLLWTVYDAFGVLGLNLLVLIAGFVTLFIIHRICMLVSDGRFIVSYGVSMAAGIMMIFFMTQRPATFSIILFALELLALETYVKKNDRRALFVLPVLSILLVNMHAAMWPMAFVLAIPYVMEIALGDIPLLKDRLPSLFSDVHDARRSWLAITISIFAIAVAGFINPYGLEAMTYLSRSLGHDEISLLVSEMRPVDITDFTGKFVYGWMFIIAGIYWSKLGRQMALRHILLSLGTAYLALSSIRGFLLFALCASFPVAAYLKDIGSYSGENKLTSQDDSAPDVLEKVPTIGTVPIRKILLSLIIVTLTGLTVLVAIRFDPDKQVDADLLGAIEVLKAEERNAPVVLYNSYNEGALLQFHGLKPFIDTRAEVFVIENNKKRDVMKEFYDLQDGRTYYKDFIASYGFTHLLVIDYDQLFLPLQNDYDYQVIYNKGAYRIFKRTD